MSKRPIFAAAVLLLAAQHAFPQTVTRLPAVVVTAEREPESLTSPTLEQSRAELSQTPGGTAVIDAEQFQRGRATTLKDALDFAPGVYVQPRFGAEESRVSIRGSGLQRTFHGRGLKLLQDGVPLNLADGSFDFQAVEPLATRHIEIYRGANALEFGATTLGGAVNFISYSGLESARFALRAEYGSFGSARGQISTAGVSGATDHYVSLTHFSQDGFREHSQQNTQRLFANFGIRLSAEWETRFYVTAVQTDSELPGAITKTQLEDDPRAAQRDPFFIPVDVVLSHWKRDFELVRIANRTTWRSGGQRFSLGSFWSHKDLDHPILFVIDQLSNDFGISARYDNTSDVFGHRNHLTLGASPTLGVLKDNRFENHLGNRGRKFADSRQTSANLDFFAQDRFNFLPRWALVLGTQVSYASRKSVDDFPISATDPDHSDTQSWWGFSPKAGLLWEAAPDAQAFVNVSRSFEPPSFGELVHAANGRAGLVELDAQTATTVEIGTRGRRGRLSWDLAYYHAWLDAELLAFETSPGVTQTVNAGRTIHQGVEAALDFDLLAGLLTRRTSADRLVLRQVYLWNDFRFDNDAAFGDNRLAGIPEHYLRAELLYEHPCGFYAGPNVEWAPRGYNVDFAETLFADAYALAGFKIGWRRDRGPSVFLEAKNLSDEKYAATTNVIVNAGGSDSAQFHPGDGRSFFGGVEWKW